jgi:hypothetical protein
MELTKAKQKYLQYCSKPKFKPTDSAISKHCLPKQLWQAGECKESNCKLGWNPLNYKILTTLLEKDS